MKKRFIAGAVCPQCQQQDKVVICIDGTQDWIECVECDYTEKRPEKQDLKATGQLGTSGVVKFKP